jgi:2-C-methyl-D-erythritol 4-phosphate cytidylyltransferase
MGADMPKQYLSIAGETLLAHSLRPLLACAQIERIALVLQAGDQWAQDTGILQQDKIQRVDGGLARSDSVLAGLEYLSESFAEDDWVLVHDAARPCLGAQDIEDLIEKVCDSGVGGILAQPIADTVKLAGDNATVESTVDRSRLWRAQTPQMFRLGQLRQALVDARDKGLQVTDEASAMELAGHPVQLLNGPARNIKVTVAQDLELAAWYLAAGSNEKEAD